MSVTSINTSACCRLTFRPLRDFFADRLPSAGEICQGIKELTGGRVIWISDMLPHNYIYKPMPLDAAEIHSDDEYKALKKIKKARYLHYDLISAISRPDRIIRDVMSGDTVLRDQFILSAYETGPAPAPKEIHPEFENPLVFSITHNDMFDVYACPVPDSSGPFRSGGQYTFADHDYDLTEVSRLHLKTPGDRYVIQADHPVRDHTGIADDSAGIFRIRTSLPGRQQYFRAGSVFDIKDSIDMDAENAAYPFIIFI